MPLLHPSLFLPRPIQPSCCPRVLRSSSSDPNSCAHRHRHAHARSRCKPRLSNPFPAKFSPRIPARLTPAMTGDASRGLISPKVFPTSTFRRCLSPARFGGRLAVFGGGDAAGEQKAFPTQTGPGTGLSGHMGDRSGGPGGPRPAARPGPARHSPHFAPNFAIGGIRLSLPPPSSGLSAELGSDAARRVPAVNEAMPPFIYLPRSSFPPACAPFLTDVDDGVRPHRKALKYPGEKPEHQHFHFQPLAQHISPGLVERQTGEKKRKRARAGGARRRGGRCPDTP